MRRIVKGIAPASFTAWKAQANEDWTATYDNLPNPEKNHLHEALLEEQGWVCCYCGRRMDINDSHIEHFRPRDDYPDLELDFANLYASCLRGTVSRQVLHCGHAKGQRFDEALHISPLSAECEQQFAYTLDGNTIPTSTADNSAPYMIGVLNLNAAFLRNRRAEALAGTFDNDFLLWATAEELQVLRDYCDVRDELGRFGDFSHVIGRYAEQLLQASPPAEGPHKVLG